MSRACSTYEKENIREILVDKPERQPGCGWEDNIEMDFKEI
jgi:hypothetical protein